MLLGLLLSLLSACHAALSVLEHGGERQIRPLPPPPAPGPRVLIFAIDGAGYNELLRAIRSGRASRLQTLLGAEQQEGRFAHAYSVPNALSILPSTTVAAWASIFTGQPPAQTGVPGNEWFVREQRRFFAPAPVSVTELDDFSRTLTEGLVGNVLRVPTLYELLGVSSHVALSQVYRGATFYTTVDPAAFLPLMVDFVEGVVSNDDVAAKQDLYATLDEAVVSKLIAALTEHGAPVIQTAYLPGVDLFTHKVKEPTVPAGTEVLPLQVAYLENVTAKAIDEVLQAYERLGVLEQTYVLLIADHGHTPVLQDDRHDLGTDGDHEPPALLERTGFRLRKFVLTPGAAEQDYQATVAYQGICIKRIVN